MGGKRWFNFAKQLSQHNKVDVISTGYNDKCTFINSTYKIKQKYPRILDEYPKNIFQSFRYKISLFLKKSFQRVRIMTEVLMFLKILRN
ncbi:MAG: hypothetical protein CM15mP65_18290 [Crocinitomicaceae bacterium]|nr:MAG: hypothetical protein CM15mP65_18290 [Crocinitomicaceae bacterium]